MRILFLLLFLFPITAYGASFNVAIDKNTGEIVEMSRGGTEIGVTGDSIIKVRGIEGLHFTRDGSDFLWDDKNSNGAYEEGEIRLKTQADRDSRAQAVAIATQHGTIDYLKSKVDSEDPDMLVLTTVIEEVIEELKAMKTGNPKDSRTMAELKQSVKDRLEAKKV